MLGYVLFILILRSVSPLSFNDDNKLLSLILEEDYNDGGYTVVEPKTTIRGFDGYGISIDPLIVHGYNYEPLIHQLIERNRQAVRLTIKSDPSNGYIIDTDDKFSKYFLENGGGWNKLYKENPNVRSLTSVSLPVYDEKANLILVYKSFTQHYLAGEGNLIVYSFNSSNGKLQELTRTMLWIS